MKLRTRIVGHGDVAPDQLLANPLNFRRHPGAQREVLRSSLGELGWVKTVIVNQRTGHVLDGHARVEEAMFAGAESVPVTYVDLDPNEEHIALALLDRISGMATTDDEILAALLQETETDDPVLQAALADLESSPGKLASEGEIGVSEAEVGRVSDTFWLNVRGPLPEQMAVLERLRSDLEALPGVTVEIGTTT
jgi:ParB-like chromosome segregation protein Spo0J